MSIYKTVLEFSDGRTLEDLWPEKTDALSYIENAPAYDGCTRAELWEWYPEGVTFKPHKCIRMFKFMRFYECIRVRITRK